MGAFVSAFSEHHVSVARMVAYEHFSLFHNCITFHSMTRPHSDYPFISQWVLGVFPPLALVNSAAVNVYMCSL